MSEEIPNTPAQQAFHNAQEAAWEEEQTWPMWQVELSGDDVPWVPRKDENYWQPVDPNDPDSPWEPKPEDELPDDATIVDGNVVRTARAVVSCRARSEEQAKMMALRDNPAYHTVESVTKVEQSEQ